MLVSCLSEQGIADLQTGLILTVLAGVSLAHSRCLRNTRPFSLGSSMPLGQKVWSTEEGKGVQRKGTANHAVIMLPGAAGRELKSR